MEYKANAETFRLRAIGELFHGDVSKARTEIQRAKEMAPKWQNVRLTEAIINYYSSLSQVALPKRFSAWPEPTDWTLVKTDDLSLQQLQIASEIFLELAQAANKIEERKNYEVWHLACLANSPEKQNDALKYCQSLLNADPINYRAIIWSIGRNFKIDLKTSIVSLEEQIRRKRGTVFTVIALSACYLHIRKPSKAVEVMKTNRKLFTTDSELMIWCYWYTRGLLILKNKNKAIKELEAVKRMRIPKPLMAMAEAALSHRRGDWQALEQQLQKSYSESREPKYLLDLCELKAQMNQWDYIVEKADDLVTLVGTIYGVRLAAISAYNAGAYDKCLEILDKNLHVFPGKKISSELLRLRAMALQSAGMLTEAMKDAERLVGENPTTENFLLLANIQYSLGNIRSVVTIAQNLLDRTDLSVQQALQLAKVILIDDRYLSTNFWLKAQRMGIPEKLVGVALEIGFQLGLDKEVRPLLETLPKIAASGLGGFQAASIQDMINNMRKWRDVQQRMSEMYEKGDVPIHIALDKFNVPLVKIYHGLLQKNKQAISPATKHPIFIRYGGRGVDTGFIEKNQKLRLNVDITSIILAEHLNVLQLFEQNFAPLRIPTETIPALLDMKAKLEHKQPSRLEAYKKIISLVENKQIMVSDFSLSDDYPDKQLIDKMGKYWVAMIEDAHSNGGYLLEYLPLHTNDATLTAMILPDALASVVIDIRAILNSLYKYGPLSETEFNKMVDSVGSYGIETHSRVTPFQQKSLFCVGNIPEVLANAGILDMICERFKVYIERSEYESLQAELREYAQNQELQKWLDGLVSKIRYGITKGLYLLLPKLGLPTQKVKGIPLNQFSSQCLLSLMTFKAEEGDVVLIDDRKSNSFLYREGAPIVGLSEVLSALRSRGALPVDRYYEIILELRASDARFLPLENEEILYHLKNAGVEQGNVNETRELKILRQYVAKLLLDEKALQKADPNSPTNVYGEIPFVISINRVIIKSIVDLWKGNEEDEVIQAKADWILSNLYVDYVGLAGIISIAPQNIDERYMMAVGTASFLLEALNFSAKDINSPKRKKYFEWLYNRLVSKTLGSDELFVDAIADVVKNAVLSIIEKKDAPFLMNATMLLIRSFYEDLFDPLKSKLMQDVIFMEAIGYEVSRTSTFRGLHFKREEFFQAISEAINGREATIKVVNSDEKAVLRPLIDENGKLGITFEHPSTGEPTVVKDDIMVLLHDSLKERKRVLQEHKAWFDCEKSIRNQAIEDIISTEKGSDRVEKTQQWVSSSMSLFYASLYQKVNASGAISYKDLIPVSANSILNYLQLGHVDDKNIPFQELLENATQTLLEDETLIEVFKRLAGLPVPISGSLHIKINNLTPDGYRAFVKELIKTIGSPISKLHFLNVLLQTDHKSESYVRLARKVVKRMLEEDNRQDFNAFKAVLQWVETELYQNKDFKKLSSRFKLACIWSHANNLYSIFVSLGVPTDWIVRRFLISRIRHHAFERHTDYWQDIAHPRHLTQTSLYLTGILYSVGDNLTEILDKQLFDTLNELIFPKGNESGLPNIRLLEDRTLFENNLGSFFVEDFSDFVSVLRNKETFDFKAEALEQLAEHCIETLEDSKQSPNSWMLLRVIWGNNIPPARSIKRFMDLLLQTDFVALYKQSHTIGDSGIIIASQQTVNCDDDRVRTYVKESLFKVAKYFSEIPYSDIAEQRKREELPFDLEAMLIEAALNLSNCLPDSSDRVMEFGKLVTELCDIWPKLPETSKLMFQIFVEEFPITEVKHFWPIVLRSRLY